MIVKAFSLSLCLGICYIKHRQVRRRKLSVLYAPDAVPSRKAEKTVVVVAEVLGSEAVEALSTQNIVTRGTKASGPVKHGRSSRELVADGQTRPND